MDNETTEINEMIRSKAYFEHSRSWYQSVYIRPISERTFFLIIALLAGIIAFAGVIAALSLMPLVARPGIFIGAQGDIDNSIPRLIPLKRAGDPVNPAIMKFFVSQYIISREEYSAPSYQKNARFVRAQSDPAVFEAFSSQYIDTNPNSFAAQLGAYGERRITINSVSFSKANDIHAAKVAFVADIVGTEKEERTRWTATIQYKYTELTMQDIKDPETGEKQTKIQDPQFQVVGYEIKQSN